MLRAYCSPSLLDLHSESHASTDGDELHQCDFIMGKESSAGNLGLESTTWLWLLYTFLNHLPEPFTVHLSSRSPWKEDSGPLYSCKSYVDGGIWQSVMVVIDLLLHECSLYVCGHMVYGHRDGQGSASCLRGSAQQSSMIPFSLQSGGKQVGQGWSFRMKTSQPR